MITISYPQKELCGDKVCLKAFVSDSVQGINDEVCFSTTIEYGDYLCDEVGDAFLVGMLLAAIITKQKIKINAPISERLYHNIEHSVSTILNHVYVEDKNHSKVTEWCNGIVEMGDGCPLVTKKYCGEGVATGCSLGVDSLSSYLTYTAYDCPNSYRLTHLTFFNAGAMGFHDEEKAKESYQKDLNMVRSFAKEVNLPLVCIESNITKWYNKLVNFGQCAVMINMSVVLSMQKLFSKYYFASSFPIWETRFDKGVMEYYESLLLPLLSTESTELIVANPEMTRVAKESFIFNNQLTQKYLYVCWKEIRANENPDSIYAKIKDDYLNCTRCDKCLRTLLAIDILGYIDQYRSLFDIDYYNKVKSSYIAKVIAGQNSNSFYKELYSLIQEHNYPLSVRIRFLAWLNRMTNPFRKLGNIKFLYSIYNRIMWKR